MRNQETKKRWHHQNWLKNRERISRQRKSSLFEVFGSPMCKSCGFTDIRALQIDHINGGGSKERKESNGRVTLLKRVRKSPSNYQILCANCNWIKRAENKEATGRPRTLLI